MASDIPRIASLGWRLFMRLSRSASGGPHARERLRPSLEMSDGRTPWYAAGRLCVLPDGGGGRRRVGERHGVRSPPDPRRSPKRGGDPTGRGCAPTPWRTRVTPLTGFPSL